MRSLFISSCEIPGLKNAFTPRYWRYDASARSDARSSADAIFANSGARGLIPCPAFVTESIAANQKSPIFCALLPLGDFAFAAADLLIASTRWYVSSCTTFAIPHARSAAGMGCALSHLPTEYW